jgi:hypothetical protein
MTGDLSSGAGAGGEVASVIASEAKQSSFPQSQQESWIASSLRSSQ